MFKMKRIFDKFVKQTCQRKHCKEALKMLTHRKNLASRKHLFTEWLLGAFNFRRANIFYAKRAMARGLNWLQLGIAN